MMNKLLLLCLTAIVLWAQEYGLEPVRVTPGLYCFFGALKSPNTKNNGNMVNSCWLDAGSGWIVFDSGPTRLYAKESHETMQRIKRMPLLAVFNSHVHDDHWLGNGFYREKGVPIYGSGAFKNHEKLDDSRMKSAIAPAFFKGTVPVPPDHIVTHSKHMKIGGLELEVIVFNEPAHSQSDLALFVPDKGVLLAGDLVFNDRLPSLRDGSLKGWRKAVKRLRTLHWRTAVGGHGYKTGADALDFIDAYLAKLQQKIEKALEEDIDMTQIATYAAMPEYGHMAMYDLLHGKNVIKAYEELEWESE